MNELNIYYYFTKCNFPFLKPLTSLFSACPSPLIHEYSNYVLFVSKDLKYIQSN